MSEPLVILQALVERLDQGQPCALCTVVNTRGSTPQTAGAMLLVDPSGETQGTIGGGCVEAEVRRRALALLRDGESALLRLALDHDFGWDDGLICGGSMEVAVVSLTDPARGTPFREAAARLQRQEAAQIPLRVRHEQRVLEYRLNVDAAPTLLIAGAGHVGAAVAKLAMGLDFRVVVIDDRADLLTPARLPPPIETAPGDIRRLLAEWPIGPNTYVVIVTRGHSHDEQALQAVIDSPAKYVGMIGSKRKIQVIFDDLERLGVAREKLDRVRAPIGLKIGAVTVPEIAVSIVAELIHVRRAEPLRAVEGPLEVRG